MNKFLEFVKSKKFTTIIMVVFALALLAGTFSFGAFVGFRKASFSYSWGENYHRNFAGPRAGIMGGMMNDFTGGDFIEAHGTFGQILKIDGKTLIVNGRDNVEKIIVIKDDTTIRFSSETIKLADLKAGENITVIGEPNDSGQIEAKFIRVLPLPVPTDLKDKNGGTLNLPLMMRDRLPQN